MDERGQTVAEFLWVALPCLLLITASGTHVARSIKELDCQMRSFVRARREQRVLGRTEVPFFDGCRDSSRATLKAFVFRSLDAIDRETGGKSWFP